MSVSGTGKPRLPQTQFGVQPARAVVTPHRVSSPTALGDTGTTDPGWPDLTGPAADLQAGTLIGQYELIREIGRGGMGVVWAARDTKLGRRVAMKFLHHASREVADRFLVEARATAQCEHDNIVVIHAADEYAGMPYMVLEYLHGKTLRDVLGGDIGSGHRLPPSRAIELAIPIARALERAHERGIVHRDLKPENVFVTEAGQVKVLDFGIAKSHAGTMATLPAGATPADLTRTSEGAILGTLPYMSPEQLAGVGVDHRTDLWALGIILFELLTGRHPVDPMASDTLLENLVMPTPMISVREVMPELPEGLGRIVDACLHKDQEERTGSARELVALLEEQLPGRQGRALREGESPYPGLSAFQEADANRFFGRSRDVARGVARIRELPLIGVVGPSGVGKSSYLRAGIGPALKSSGERWDVVTMRPGRAPLAALASVIERVTSRTSPGAAGVLGDHQALIHRLRYEPGLLGSLLRERARDTGANILLFVDQFEELYTLVPEADQRLAFTAALAGVADDSAAPLRVVLSMRSDFLDRVGEDPRFMEELSRGLVFLSPPDRDGLREALVEPVEMVGYRFETTAMIGEMLDTLAETPGALPLLQFAAAKLWDGRDRDRKLLTASSYHAIGGISGALATHADDVIAALPPSAQRLAQRVFRQLVTPERTRAIVELADLHELGGDDELARVIDQLVTARLLVVQSRGEGGGSVEIVHESLIDRWPTLRRWLDEDQEDAAFLAQLGATAKQWDQRGRPVGLLWRGDAMEEARRWSVQRARPVPARDQAYLDAVFALAHRGRRVRRFGMIAGFVAMAAITVGASIAYVRISAAEERAVASMEKTKRALLKAEESNKRAATKDKEAAAATAVATRAERATGAAQMTIEQQKAEVDAANRALEDKNVELVKKAGEAASARDKAMRASAAATQSAAEASRLNAELQKTLARERAKVRALEEEKKRLTTKLKD